MEKFTKKQLINELKIGELEEDIFVVQNKKTISPYKNKEGYYFVLVLSDSSGKYIEYKYWGGEDADKTKDLFQSIKPDSVILINGKIKDYNGKLEINADIKHNIRVLSPEEYEAEFIMGSKKDPEQMHTALISKINSIQNEQLKKFLLNLFEHELKDKFKKHPGAMMIHHNWLGGLLEHTLEVIEYCETSIKLNPELDKDLLLAGAILHDIGKIEELKLGSRIKISRKGYFLGHLALGMIFVSEKLQNSGLDELLKEKLLHLSASNHGKLEFGSPKEPIIPEALVLYYADEISSKVPELIEFIKENQDTGDDFAFNYRKKANIFLK